MADFEKVQLQVEVVRTQLDSLIKDVNNLKAQKLNFTVDSSGLEAINRFNSSVQAMTQNVDGLSGKFTRIWAGAADGAPTRTIETVNEGLGRTTEIIRTLDEETQQYTTVQTKATTNYDAMAKAAQKAAEKAEKAAKEQAKETENAASKVDTLRKGFADLGLQMKSAAEKYPTGTFSEIESDAKQASAALENLYSSWKSGAISDKEFVAGVKDASGSLKNLRANYAQTRNETDKLTNSTNVLGDTFGHIVGKITVWQVVNAAVAKVKRSFTEAIDTMKQVDTEMTAIQKVTGNTAAEMEKLGNTAYEAASKYGVAVTDYLESVGTFAKAGYKDMSEDMAELATKTQLVGDVTSSIANQFILSADAAFKFEGNVTALNTVLDKANEIENNYATSIQKMAEGFPIVANVASMANMSIDELMAALGTITAVTQESGTKAATALRALILNIIGDTETEIEDGVAWTKEEIESLNDALWIYAEDAMKAAQASGKIVDPMKAIAALSQAYKDGLLSQAELAELESKLGGKLRTNQLDALIKNYDMYAAMLDKVANSAGSADKEVDIMLTSWDAKAKILNNTWTKFIADTVDSNWAKGFLDTLTWLIDGFGNLGTAVTIFGGVLVAFKWNSIVGSFKTLGSVIGALPMLFSSAKGGAAGFDAGMKALNVSLTSTQLLVGAVVVAISGLVIAYNKIKTSIEESRQAAIDAGEASSTEAKEIVSLYQNYEDLRKAVEDGTGSKTEFIDVSDRLIDKLGIEKSSVYDLKKELGGLSGAYKEAAAAKIESALYDAKNATLAAGANLTGNKYAIQLGLNTDEEDVLKHYDDLISRRNQLIDSGSTDNFLYRDVIKEIETLKPLVEEYNSAVENQTYLEGALKAAQDGTLDSYLKSEDAINDYSDALDNAAEAEKTTVETLQEYAKTLKQQESDLTTASQALAEYQQNGRVSASTMKSLISMSDQYVNALTDENGKLDVSEKKLRDLVEAILDDVDATNNLIGVTKKSSGAMGSFVTGLKNAAKQSGVTDDAIDGVVAQMIIFNNTALSVSDKIAALQTLALQAGVTQSAIAGISLNNIGRDAGMTAEEAQTKYGMSAAEAQRYVKSQAEKARNNDQALIDYWNSLASKIPETKTSSGGGGSSSDANLEAHKQKVELLKSELTLLEKQNASEDTQKDKMRQIQQALHAQAQYLRSIGGSQSDINALSAEWWEWQEKINGTLKNTDDLLNELQGVMSDKLSDLSDQRQNELDAIDAQIDALKQQKDTRDEQLDLEEKILAVQQAQAKLANAQNERTVRQYNARTGQWEWVADQKEVDSAQKALDEAKKDLEDFKANMAYEAALAELEAQKKTINEQYDDLETAYKDFLKSIKEKTRGIGEILQDIWKNATPELRQIIQENAELFKQFGFDVSQLSDAVNDTAKKLYGISKNGDKYEIGSDKGLDFINNKPAGSTMTGGDGSTWTKNEDGTVTIVDKDGVTYTVYPNGGSGGTEDSTGGSASGPKYSGTVFAKRLDGKGDDYKISSADGLNFLNNALAGEKLDGGDGSHWVKNADGTTSITDKYGIAYKVYDQGGILHGMGGIKATMQDEGITPPDVTAMLKKHVLTPVEDRNFSQNMDSIRWMMSSNGIGANAIHNASYDNHSIGTQNNGTVYKFNGITINEPQASGMTLKQFADIAHNLGNFS
jgi:TP901 family phage tail tape measure protein